MIPGVIWLAVLHDSEGKRVSEIVLRDPELITEALHGRWTVEEYIFTREIKKTEAPSVPVPASSRHEPWAGGARP